MTPNSGIKNTYSRYKSLFSCFKCNSGVINKYQFALKVFILLLLGFNNLVGQEVTASPEFDLNASNQNFSLNGVIQDVLDYSLFIKYEKNEISNQEETFELPILKDGSFGIDFHLAKPTLINVNYAGQSFDLYIEPGNDLTISFKADDILETIKIEGRGSEQNNYLIAARNRFKDKNENFILYEMSRLGPMDFKASMDWLLDGKQVFYDTYDVNAKRKFSVDFKHFVQNENLYWHCHQLLNYRIEKPLLIGGPVPMELPTAYYTFLDDLQICNQDALPNRTYTEFVEEYLKYKAEQKDQASVDFQQIELEIGKKFVLEEDGSTLQLALGSTINIPKEKKSISLDYKVAADRNSRITDWIYVGLPDGRKGWITSAGLEKSNKEINKDRKVERYAVARYHNLYLLKDPTEEEVVGKLGLGEELTYFHLKTSEDHLYMFNGTPYYDLLCKVKTKSGLEGWVSESTLEFRERIIQGDKKDESYVYSLTDTSDSRKYLEGEVLFYSLAKALYWEMQLEDLSHIGRELAAFRAINPYDSFNKILKSEFEVTQLKSKGNGSYVENYAHSNISNPNIHGVVKQLPFEDQKVYASRSLRARKVKPKKYVDIPFKVDGPSKSLTHLSGKISNAASKAIFLHVLHETIAYKEEIIEIKPDASGHFDLKIEMEKPAVVTLHVNNEVETFYLKPRDELQVNFDANQLNTSLFFGGKDDILNNLLAHLQQTFKSEIESLIDLSTNNIDNYKSKLTDLWKRQSSYFNKLLKKQEIPNNIKDFIKAEIDFSYAVNMMYGLDQAGLGPRSKGYNKSNYKFINQLQVSQQDIIANQNYAEFVYCYFDYLKQLPENSGSSISELAEMYLNGEPLDYIKAKELAKQCKLGKAYQAGPSIKTFIENSEEEQFNQILRVVYNETKELNEGALAPDFSLADINGNMVNLSDFRGKVVFIDFWATWCRPCIKMMHYNQELKNFYKNKDVVFLFVSMDEDNLAWKNYVERKDFQGIHLNVKNGKGYQSDIAKLYKVRKLPITMLIDQEGRVSYNPSASPSSNRIYSQINALLANPKF